MVGARARDFDDIVVGSSPALLARAINRSSDGRRVAVIDSHTSIGGSWRLVGPFEGEGHRYDAFEHLLAGGAKARRFLTSMSIPLRERPITYLVEDGVNPEERRHVLDIFRPDDPSILDGRPNLLPVTEGRFLYQLRMGRICDDDLSNLSNQLASDKRLAQRRDSDRNFYFERSMADLLEPLEAGLRRYDVGVFLGDTVEYVEATNDDSVAVVGSFGALRCQRVLVGKYFTGRFIGRKGEVSMTRHPNRRLTLIVRTRSSSRQPYEYVKVLGWKGLHAVQRVSDEREERSGSTTFCFHLPHVLATPCSERDPVAEAGHLAHELSQRRVLNPDTIVSDAAWIHLDFQRGVEHHAQEIAEGSKTAVDVLAFTSLGRDIVDNQDVWRLALNSSGSNLP